jgi:hypothetical protein
VTTNARRAHTDGLKISRHQDAGSSRYLVLDLGWCRLGAGWDTWDAVCSAGKLDVHLHDGVNVSMLFDGPLHIGDALSGENLGQGVPWAAT